jgi:hypothetical protein
VVCGILLLHFAICDLPFELLFRPGFLREGNAQLKYNVEIKEGSHAQAKPIAGATPVREPADQPHGDRMSGVLDPFSYKWWVAAPIKLQKEVRNVSRR